MRKSLIRKVKNENGLHPAKAIVAEMMKPDCNFYLLFVFVGSMCLAVWSINIYRNTFMDWRILILPSVIGCLAANALFFSKLRRAGEKVWVSIFICSICGGCTAHFLTTFTNRQFADAKEQQQEVFAIIRKGNFAKGRGSCGEPYASIDFHGLEKDIVFACGEETLVFQADSVWIACSKGLFGFEVIQAKSLL